jgi:hypothetical protein
MAIKKVDLLPMAIVQFIEFKVALYRIEKLLLAS